ncbi:MAG TPA: hypothetical protein VM639_06640 [Dongiaceae bacterium]|nr:hypothetical protein [Dongiaceae bacterium]
MVMSQPMREMLPAVARFAGSMKTPDPIILPATIRIAGTKEILLSETDLLSETELAICIPWVDQHDSAAIGTGGRIDENSSPLLAEISRRIICRSVGGRAIVR